MKGFTFGCCCFLDIIIHFDPSRFLFSVMNTTQDADFFHFAKNFLQSPRKQRRGGNAMLRSKQNLMPPSKYKIKKYGIMRTSDTICGSSAYNTSSTHMTAEE